ncbi:MAG: DUF6774 domain-containing protein [Lachnospiraceae bacterium]|nr:hypothetical protein [bacterium]MDY5517048.1 DUF6774 domain-containing protein [Lachnospiraceae bacterium]
MNPCSNLFYLSSIACGLSECLSEKELTKLSADLVVLSDMLANILAQQALCVNDETDRQTADSPQTPTGDCLTS